MSITTPAITTPTLIIRACINGSPINFTVSLFALPPRHVSAVGYGSVSINLETPTILNVTNIWIKSEIPGYTSLIAVITCVKSDEVRSMIITIPHNPTWIMQRKLIMMTATNIPLFVTATL